jgi:hypothetical protein
MPLPKHAFAGEKTCPNFVGFQIGSARVFCSFLNGLRIFVCAMTWKQIGMQRRFFGEPKLRAKIGPGSNGNWISGAMRYSGI